MHDALDVCADDYDLSYLLVLIALLNMLLQAIVRN